MKIYQVDAFTDKPFTGNPAGVVRASRGPKEDAWMQKVGRRNEPLGDGLSAAAGRWLPAALVHAGGGGGALRPCDLGLGPHPLGNQLLSQREPVRFHTSADSLRPCAAGMRSSWIFRPPPMSRQRYPPALLKFLEAAPQNFRSSRYDHLVGWNRKSSSEICGPDFTR